ncbi:MAG: DUF427 domain-containing protein [Pseudonocardiaceae bacterium]|nr:DUF427 domain-containing protein [Pseudonocardiaceae bacterium]
MTSPCSGLPGGCLPPRYYLPLADVRTELFRSSKTRTHCPYKGTATYWSVVVGRTGHEDLAALEAAVRQLADHR